MATQMSDLIRSSAFDFEYPVGDITQGKLLVLNGASKLKLGSSVTMPQLVRARFERPHPDVELQDGNVLIRYPSYSLLNWLVYWRQPMADLTLNASIPWNIEGRGGVSSFQADLSQIHLQGINLQGGVSHFWAKLPEPSGSVTVRIVGGVSQMALFRPTGIPVRIQIRGGVGSLKLDEQHFGSMGNLPTLETPGYNEAVNRYEIQITGGVSNITIDTLAPGNRESGRRLE